MITLQERVFGYLPPTTWERSKLHYMVCVRKGFRNTGMQENNLLSLSYGQIIEKDINVMEGLLPQSFETYQIVEPGNIILRLMDLQNDKHSLRQGLVKRRGIITSAYDALDVGGNNDPRFWAYLLLALDLAKYYYSLGGGVRQSIKFADFPNEWLSVPAPPTQRRIADFLDCKITRIDQLIMNKQRLVELLNEKSLALITEAFTKGFYPVVPIKGPGSVDCGNPAGSGGVRIPYQILRLKGLAEIRTSNVDKIINENEKPILLCNYTDVYNNERITDQLDFSRGSANDREINRFMLKKGDVVITKDSEARDDIGVPALVEAGGAGTICGYHLAILRPFTSVIRGDYLFWYLKSLVAAFYFTIHAEGITRYGLTVDDMGSIPVPTPDLVTQKRVAKFLDQKAMGINSTQGKIVRSIEKLREYRSALITAAVTGRIDVDTWQWRGNTERGLEAIEKEAEA